MLTRPATYFCRAAKARALAVALCSTLLATASLGCAGGTQLRGGIVFDHPVYYVDRPPPRLRRRPIAYYHGRPAYLVEGRWYYSSPRGWVVFRREPRELRRVREARSARRYDDRDRSQRRYRSDEPAQRRQRESRDARRDEPTERRYRRLDPN
jgi:hypothetical protein